jgi:hypothetical protein
MRPPELCLLASILTAAISLTNKCAFLNAEGVTARSGRQFLQIPRIWYGKPCIANESLFPCCAREECVRTPFLGVYPIFVGYLIALEFC